MRPIPHKGEMDIFYLSERAMTLMICALGSDFALLQLRLSTRIDWPFSDAMCGRVANWPIVRVPSHERDHIGPGPGIHLHLFAPCVLEALSFEKQTGLVLKFPRCRSNMRICVQWNSPDEIACIARFQFCYSACASSHIILFVFDMPCRRLVFSFSTLPHFLHRAAANGDLIEDGASTSHDGLDG